MIDTTRIEHIHGVDYNAVAIAVKRAMEPLLGRIRKTDRVLLKVNCVYDRYCPGVVTSPVFLDAVIESLLPYCHRIAVCESDDIFHTASAGLRRCGLMAVLQRHGVPFLDLTYERSDVRLLIESPTWYGHLSSLLKGFDYIISLPVIKTHFITRVSLSIKNLFGLYALNRVFLHPVIDRALVALIKYLPPIMAVADGIIALEGNGPIPGRPRPLHVVAAGTSIVELDAVLCRIMGLDPFTVNHLYLCHREELGRIPASPDANERVSFPPFLGAHRNIFNEFGTWASLHRWSRMFFMGFTPLWMIQKTILHTRKNLLWYHRKGLPATRKFLHQDPLARLNLPYLPEDWDGGGLALRPLTTPLQIHQNIQTTGYAYGHA